MLKLGELFIMFNMYIFFFIKSSSNQIFNPYIHDVGIQEYETTNRKVSRMFANNVIVLSLMLSPSQKKRVRKQKLLYVL